MPQRQMGSLEGVTIRIDRTLCVGFGDCVTAAPEAFELDGEDIAVLLPGAAALPLDRLRAACESCPVSAITLLDSEGRELAP